MPLFWITPPPLTCCNQNRLCQLFLGTMILRIDSSMTLFLYLFNYLKLMILGNQSPNSLRITLQSSILRNRFVISSLQSKSVKRRSRCNNKCSYSKRCLSSKNRQKNSNNYSWPNKSNNNKKNRKIRIELQLMKIRKMTIHSHIAKTLTKSKTARSSMNQRVEIRTETGKRLLSHTSKVTKLMILMNKRRDKMDQILWDLLPVLILRMQPDKDIKK